MKKSMIKSIKIILISMVFISCQKEYLSTRSIFKNADIEIHLRDIQDSRCPTGVDCIWEGEVIVEMTVTDGNQSVDFSLEGDHADTVLLDHSISLIKVEPYPEKDKEINLKDYKVYLKVNKN